MALSWLQKIIKDHEEYEAPKAFWYWAALAALSATVRDNVYLDNWIYKLYPNIYVMFHAESGMKKGPPVSLARSLVQEVNNTKIIRGRFSIQGALKKLGEAETKPGGQISAVTSAFICSSELTSSIVTDGAAMDILTDLYDRNYNFGDWENILVKDTFKLRAPCVTMLTATNEAHSSDFFAKKDTHGGYIARTFIIYENKRNTINSLAAPPLVIPNIKEYAEYLKEAAKLKGSIQPLGSLCATDHYRYRTVRILPGKIEKVEYLSEVGKIYDDWYHEFVNAIDSHEVKDETGTLNRFGDSVLKVAILLSLAEKLELVISENAMREAIVQCEKLIGNVRKATLGRGKSQFAQEKALIITELVNRTNHMITRKQANKKFYMHMNTEELDKIADSLMNAGIISIEQQGNEVVYVMLDDQVERWRQHFKGKNQ